MIVFIHGLFSLLLASTSLVYDHKNNHQLRLPDEVQKALKAYDPHFQPRKYSDFIPIVRSAYKTNQRDNLFSVIGDFNGDGLQDLVLMGSNKTNDLLVGVLSKDKAYSVVSIEKSPKTDPKTNWIDVPPGEKQYGLWTFVQHVGPGKKTSPYEKEPIELKADGFSQSFWGKAGVVYYFEKGQFKSFIASD
ncbi:MAG: hypothetical protein AAF203_04905 [Pseudomonadota bacterium]